MADRGSTATVAERSQLEEEKKVIPNVIFPFEFFGKCLPPPVPSVGWIQKEREDTDLISNIWGCRGFANISDLDSTRCGRGFGPTVSPQPETFVPTSRPRVALAVEHSVRSRLSNFSLHVCCLVAAARGLHLE